MSKKAVSIILLCIALISFILMLILFVNTGISIYELNNAEIDSSREQLPLVSPLAVAFASISMWIGFIVFGGAISSVGGVCSLINIKIAENKLINRISKVFLYIYASVLVLIFGIIIYFLFAII